MDGNIQARIQSGTIDLALFVGHGRCKSYDYIVMPHVVAIAKSTVPSPSPLREERSSLSPGGAPVGKAE